MGREENAVRRPESGRMTPLDLSVAPPRPPRETLAGVVLLARTVDKLRAALPGGNLGEYAIPGFSQMMADALDIPMDALANVVAEASSDDDVAALVQRRRPRTRSTHGTQRRSRASRAAATAKRHSRRIRGCASAPTSCWPSTCSPKTTVNSFASDPRMSPKVGSLGAFWPLLEPVLDALAPRRLCEVGVEGGAFASQLLAWCARRDCSYIGIDPDPPADLAALAARGELAGAMIRGTSHEELPGLEACDAYFLVGDHNYYTMRGELDAIAARVERDGRPGPLICAHDVAWPWARRDMYYAPDRIPLEHRHAYSERLGVVAGSDDLVDGGLRDPGRYAIACRPAVPATACSPPSKISLRAHALRVRSGS